MTDFTDLQRTRGAAWDGLWNQAMQRMTDTTTTLESGYTGAAILSDSAVTVGAGARTWTVGPGRWFAAGLWLIAWRVADPTVWMIGQVTAYAAGEVTIEVGAGDFAGSGTHEDWALALGGQRGPAGEVAGPDSSTDTALVRWDGTGGSTVQDSSWTLADGGTVLTGEGDLHLPAHGDDVTRAIEIGYGRTGYGAARIDLIGDSFDNDYGLRVLRNGGVNANSVLFHHGSGTFHIWTISAAPVAISTNSVNRLEISSAGVINALDHPLIRARLQDTAETVQALGTLSSGTTTINLEAGNVVTATGQSVSATIAISNWPTGSATLTINATNFGAFSSLTWPAAVKWPDGEAPTLTASGRDKIVLHSVDGGTTIDGSFQLDYS